MANANVPSFSAGNVAVGMIVAVISGDLVGTEVDV